MEKMILTLQDVQEAAERIRPYARRTPLLRQENMDKALGCEIFLKAEMLQHTGAFKLRGALNKILSLPAEEVKKGIICTSSGNHAQACAYAGRMLGVPVVVVVPEDCPKIKIENTRAMGAQVILWDRPFSARWQKVKQEVEEKGYNIISSDSDFLVVAGQGTIALEVLADCPDIDTLLVPASGGGLLCGVATAAKELGKNIRVIGVQSAASAAYYYSRQAGHPVEVKSRPSIADALESDRISEKNYPIIEKYVDDFVIVEEETIKEAVKLVARNAKLIAEPSACVGIGALLSQKIALRPGEKVGAILSGGNWSLEMLGRLYNNELAEAAH